MKPLAQFFHLLKYFCTASWWIWLLPLVFIIQPGVAVLSGSTFSSLTILTTGLGMMCMMPMIFASMVFAPEIFLGMNYTTPQTQQIAAAYSSDFLITRPLDKPVVFVARYSFYWASLILPLCLLLALTIAKPSLTMTIPAKNTDAVTFYSSHLPDAEMTQKSENLLTIHSSSGRVQLAFSMVLISSAFCAFWPPFVIWLSHRRFRNLIFWCIFLGGIFSLQLLPLFLKSRFLEDGLFVIQNHLLASCVVLGILVFVGFLVARRRILGAST